MKFKKLNDVLGFLLQLECDHPVEGSGGSYQCEIVTASWYMETMKNKLSLI